MIVSELMRGTRCFFYSISILIFLILLAGCERKPEGLVIVQVNDRAITLREFTEELKKSIERDPEFSGTPEDREKLLDELITKELFIQEAIKRELDREDAFRRQIKNYYEQTLIGELIRMRLKEIPVEVSDEELRERYGLMGRSYHLDIAEIDVQGDTGDCVRSDPALWQMLVEGKCRECHEVNIDRGVEMMLEYLPPEISDAVYSLGQGDVSEPVMFEGKFYVVTCSGIEELSVPPLSEVKEQIRGTLEKQKQAKQMEEWLKALRDGADITVNREFINSGE